MTLKDEYYGHVLKTKEPISSKSKRILFNLVHDFTDRRGLRQKWEQIDEDIQEEILREWLSIIEKEIGPTEAELDQMTLDHAEEVKRMDADIAMGIIDESMGGEE